MVAKFSGKLLVTDCELLLEPSFNYETCQKLGMRGHHQIIAKATELNTKTNKCKTSATAQLIQDINLHKLSFTFKIKIIYHLIPLRIRITSVHTQSRWSLRNTGVFILKFWLSPPWCWWASTRQCWCSPCCSLQGAGGTASGSPWAPPGHIISSLTT